MEIEKFGYCLTGRYIESSSFVVSDFVTCPNCDSLGGSYVCSETSPILGETYRVFHCSECDAQTGESLTTGGLG